MTIKTPFVWSTSEYNSPLVNVADSEVPVAAAICRASHALPRYYGGGNAGLRKARDDSFQVYWPQWEAQRLARCAYGFLVNSESAADQAKFFVEMLNNAGGWKFGDKICVDAEEENGLSLKAILDWFTQVTVLVPGVVPERDFWIYSRANLLNPLQTWKLLPSQRAYLLKIATYMAGYPDNPDAWTWEQLVKAYHADTSKYGRCVVVQYAASAVVKGLSKPDYLSIECNIAEPTYLAQWQADTASRYAAEPPPMPPGSPTSDLPPSFDLPPAKRLLGANADFVHGTLDLTYDDGSSERRP
jgi:hypothetical protein